MNWMRILAVGAVGWMGAVACGDEIGDGNGNGTNNNGTGTVDAGDPVRDTGASEDAGQVADAGTTEDSSVTEDAGQQDPCQARIPSSGYGVREGRNFAPFAGVTYCDGTEFDFYAEGDGFCGASFTVLIRAAEWCGPCQAEATEIGDGVLDEYREKGVRFLSVMDQNQEGGAPNRQNCENWERVFDLDQANVDHRMLMDPAQEVSVYFPAGEDGYPGNVIVDENGVIRKRIIGFSPNLRTLRTELDRLLAD